MSDNKFTPGPWSIVPESRYDVRNIVCQVNRDNLICSDVIPSINGSPDANLIAAAPELLEALENIRNFMAYKYGEEDPYVMDADKALAKARGELNE